MADRYTDQESGIVFHYLPDLSNGVEIVVPPGADGDGTAVAIPMGALVRFFFEAILSREKAILMTKALSAVSVGLQDTLERFADHAFAGTSADRRAVIARVLRERLALEGGEEGISELEADDVADHILKAMR